MIEVIWEYFAKPGAGGRFELVFGPGGAWGKLLSDSAGFRGTTVLRDTENPQRYLIFDLWDTEAHREQAIDAHRDAYLALVSELHEWIESGQELGTFRMMNRATVRPHPAPRRRRPR